MCNDLEQPSDIRPGLYDGLDYLDWRTTLVPGPVRVPPGSPHTEAELRSMGLIGLYWKKP